MADFRISCGKFVRLAKFALQASDEIEPIFKTIRLEDDIAIVSDRRLMITENLGQNNSGVLHIIPDQALIEKCQSELHFDSVLTITYTEPLKHAVAKTTFGYIHPVNIAYQDDQPTDFDRWREIFEKTIEPPTEPNGALYIDVHEFIKLTEAAPTGAIVLSNIIDTRRPSLVADVHNTDWLAVFMPRDSMHSDHMSPVIPKWLKS